jgi:hypothetical protein
MVILRPTDIGQLVIGCHVLHHDLSLRLQMGDNMRSSLFIKAMIDELIRSLIEHVVGREIWKILDIRVT